MLPTESSLSPPSSSSSFVLGTTKHRSSFTPVSEVDPQLPAKLNWKLKVRGEHEQTDCAVAVYGDVIVASVATARSSCSLLLVADLDVDDIL